MRNVLEWSAIVCGAVLAAALAVFLAVVWVLRVLFIPVVVVLLIVVVFAVTGCAAPNTPHNALDPVAERHFEALKAARKLDGAHKTILAYECPIKPADCEAEYDRLYETFNRASRN